MLRPVSNPPNPWASTHVEWLEEPPEARLEVYEEEASEVVTENDSPDVGFRFSVNPYRGCFHACAYCLAGDTPVLMGDSTLRPLGSLRVGDVVYGTRRRGQFRRYQKTQVLAHWRTAKPAYRVLLENGTVLRASGDHRFLTERGWKYVAPAPCGQGQRPFLTTNNRLLGTGSMAATPPEDGEFRRGYLCGMIRGDGHLGSYAYTRPGRMRDEQHRFRLALVDDEGLRRTQAYLADAGLETDEFLFQRGVGERKEMHALRTSARASVQRIRELIAWPNAPSDAWRRGFLSGIFDAEGSYSGGILRIANTDAAIIGWTEESLRGFGFDPVVESVLETPTRTRPVKNVRVRGGLREHLRFFHTVDPAIGRERAFDGAAVKGQAPLGILAVEPTGKCESMYDVTTGTGDFVAHGVISHNCYARPSHQYLGFGAGTDFERKIVVKVNAPEALRRRLASRSWKGDEIAFSGNTDPYQPLEASYRLTRRCLEACLEYRNPVGLITKGILVRRDVDVLAALAREARARVHVSVPFASDRVARAMEPGVASPVRRFEAMKALADAGVPVGLSLAPLVPGLNDADVPTLLARARDAGATTAFTTMLRLPAEVLPVFTERLAAAFPDRAAHVMSQVRDARGGRDNDPRFGHRMTGRGPRWRAVADLFEVHAKRLGLGTGSAWAGPEPTTYRRPSPQGTLFEAD